MARQGLTHGLLSRSLALAVNAKGSDGIRFEISVRFGAVKDIVRREMDERRPRILANRSDDARTNRIAMMRELALAFGAVDLGVGGGVDDQGGLGCANGARDGGGVADIDAVARMRRQGDLLERCLALQLASNLSASA